MWNTHRAGTCLPCFRMLFSAYVLLRQRQDGMPQPLLPPIAPHHAGRKCLVLDLDETLVHSSFRVT